MNPPPNEGPLSEEISRLRRRIADLEAEQAEQRRSVIDLRRRQALLPSMIENFPFDFWARDPEGRCILQSAESVRNWGDLSPFPFDQQRVDPTTLAEWRENNRRALEGRVFQGSTRLVNGLGQRRDYFQIVAPIRDGDQVAGVLGINIDVTEHRRAEEALRLSEERFRLAFEEGPLGVAIIGRDRRIQHANRALCRMLGYQAEELIDRDVLSLAHPDDREANREVTAGLLEGDAPPVTWERRIVRKDGGVCWARATATVVRNAEGNVLYGLGMVEDVTERRRGEENLRQLLDVYERHRQLVAYEVHDAIAQPMAAALMNLEATLRQLGPQCVQTSREGVGRVIQLLQQGIRDARRLMTELRPPILDDAGLLPALETLIEQLHRDHQMEIDCVARIDSGRLASPLETGIYRIVQEGLANVRRHGQCGRARVQLEERQGRIRLEIADQGVGFDPERSDPSRFGLKGMQQRAELLGGTMLVQSAPGQGTRIVVDLPLIERS